MDEYNSVIENKVNQLEHILNLRRDINNYGVARIKYNAISQVVTLLTENKDFMTLADCNIINYFKHVPNHLYFIQHCLHDLVLRGSDAILLDTYIEINDLKDTIKMCLKFVLSADQIMFSFYNRADLISALQKSIEALKSI